MEKIPFRHPARSADFVTGAYSDAILVGNMLYVSGQACVDYTSSSFVLGTIEEETIRTLDNIKMIIEAAGGKMENVVKCTAHLADINDFDRYNAIYASYFPGIKPARTTVQSALAMGIKVEIDAVCLMNV
jgi:2-iminobutanoate/2-iminopropanoate deaminase